MRQRARWNLLSKVRPPGKGKFAKHRDFIVEQVEIKPDITMPELATSLEAERSVRADPSNLSKFLRRHGFIPKAIDIASFDRRLPGL